MVRRMPFLEPKKDCVLIEASLSEPNIDGKAVHELYMDVVSIYIYKYKKILQKI